MTTAAAKPQQATLIRPATAGTTAAPSRMTFANVTKGPLANEPYLVGIYGPEGVGKTTFASGAPKPIVLGIEDGSGHLNVARFPKPRTMVEVYEAIRLMTNEEHDYQSLIIDTVDAMEALLWDHICKRDEKKDIEAYGYGKGYRAAADEFRVFIKALEALQEKKGTHLFLVAHSRLGTFKNPTGPDFDRYTLRLHEHAAALIKDWVKTLLFFNYETFAKKEEGAGKLARAKGFSSGVRWIHTVRTASWDAKNRQNLPEEIPLAWAEFQNAWTTGLAAAANLREEVLAKAKELGPELEPTVREWVEKAGTNMQALVTLNNRVNARLAEMQAAQTVAPEATEKAEG